MASHKDATIEKAQSLAAAGQFAKAIEAWRELLDDTPNDANVYNTIGDLCLKKKATPEAIEAYTKAARFFLQEGFHLKAIALYKKIFKLDPDRADICAMLGDLNVVRGLMNNAVADYLAGAKLYVKLKKNTNALALFRKITKVDPRNMDIRQHVADLCLKEKLTEEAIDEYLFMGREYRRQGRGGEARPFYEQILKLVPDHAEARRLLDNPSEPEEVVAEPVEPAPKMSFGDVAKSAEKLEEVQIEVTPAPVQPEQLATLDEAKRLLAAGATADAEQMIRTLMVDDPDRDEYQAVLGRVYLAKGHGSIAFDILHPIAKAWLDHGRKAESLELIDAFLAVESGDESFLALKAEAAGVPVEPAPVAEPAAAEPAGKDAEELRIIEGFEFSPLPPAGEAIPESEPASPVAEAPEGIEVPEVMAQVELTPELAPEPVTTLLPVTSLEAGAEMSFEQFCKGLAGKADGKAETHYDLGVAYKEMGLLDEAVEEFQLAARSPVRFADACAMVAACFADRRHLQDAIVFLEQAMTNPGCTGPGLPYVKYELAVLYEDAGLTDKAAEIYATIPSLRDVGERLRLLPRGDEPVELTAAGTRRFLASF